MKKPYYIKQFHRNGWHVCSSETNLPLYDNAPYGKDKPLIFKDEDSAIEYRDRLNNNVFLDDLNPADIESYRKDGTL